MIKRYFEAERPALSSLLLILGIFLIFMVGSQLIAAVILVIGMDMNLSSMADINGSVKSHPNGWWSMIIAQGVSSFLTFIVGSVFYWKKIERKSFSDFNFSELPGKSTFLLIFASQLLSSPINGWIQDFNNKMKLTGRLSGLEEIMRAMEDSMTQLIEFIAVFDSPFKLVAAIFVIAIIAGVGEELLFRGLIQRKLLKGLKNHHAAIWISAAIFSAIHFQFYGFLPRMVLGAMFGYFYYWTGNIWVPISAHIFNNALAIMVMHLVRLEVISPEIEKLDKVPMPALMISAVLFSGLVYVIWDRRDRAVGS